MTSVSVIALAVAVVLAALVFSYNRLVRLRNRAEAALADIDVQLHRRRDLIPNLVEVVSAYARHEREVFEAVTAARARALAAADDPQTPREQQGAVEGELGEQVTRLLAVAEAYPDLKADERFAALQHELVATENKLAFSRTLYNDTTMAYRQRLESLPTRLYAPAMGFEPLPWFAVPVEERATPDVGDVGRG